MSGDITRLLHDRAILWLRSYVRVQRHQAAQGLVQPDDPVLTAAHEGRLLATEKVGAITADEAVAWRRRLHEAARWRPPEDAAPTAEVMARAADHLEGLLAQVSPSAREQASAAFSAVDAYAKTGVLGAREALGWRERLNAQLDLEPEHSPRCSRRDPRRVIPGPDRRVYDLRVTRVELYADGVVVQWHHARRRDDGDGTPRIWNEIDIETDYEPCLQELTDDLGTRYLGGGGPEFGINGAAIVRFGASAFAPAVPSAARRLSVPVAGDKIDIDL